MLFVGVVVLGVVCIAVVADVDTAGAGDVVVVVAVVVIGLVIIVIVVAAVVLVVVVGTLVVTIPSICVGHVLACVLCVSLVC